MGAAPQDRARLENETMMTVYQPALGESLDAIRDGQAIKFDGFANVGNCVSYYIITLEGIHYCEQEKIGLLKKRYASRFFSLDPVESLDIESRGENTYLRFMGEGGMLLCMSFTDEDSRGFRGMSAEDEAMQFARAYSA
jgi:hypothetical protein